MVPKVTLQDFLHILDATLPKIGKIWKPGTLGGSYVKETKLKPQKERTQVLVARQSKAPFGGTTIEKNDS